jgi:hypothetical protein
MTKINLNLIVAATETLTSEMAGKVWAEISYWLHISCYKRSTYINLQTKTFELPFVSMFTVSSAYIMVKRI